ncbi:MAG: UxaA family hydrolase [Syntrophales bacterium]
MAKALKINPRDNVAVLLGEIQPGETVDVQTGSEVAHVQARQQIAFGHKIALVSLAVDQPIIKYGEEIGRALTAISVGDWIHLHNLYCRRGHQDGAK